MQGLAVYCGEEGGERSVTPLLQVLSDFALSLENGVKKYDKRVEAEKKKAAKKKAELEKGKGKENCQVRRNAMVAPSSLQPHVHVTNKVRKVATANRGRDSMSAVLAAVKERAASQPGNGAAMSSSSTNKKSSVGPQQALLGATSVFGAQTSAPPSEPPAPDKFSDRVNHTKKETGRKESRVLLVNRMLSEAPANVKQGECSVGAMARSSLLYI